MLSCLADHWWPQNRKNNRMFLLLTSKRYTHFIRTFYVSNSVFLIWKLNLYTPIPTLTQPPPRTTFLRAQYYLWLQLSDKGPTRVQHKVTQHLIYISPNPHCFTSFKFKILPQITVNFQACPDLKCMYYRAALNNLVYIAKSKIPSQHLML